MQDLTHYHTTRSDAVDQGFGTMASRLLHGLLETTYNKPLSCTAGVLPLWRKFS
jgi:hypothetical protein